MGQLSCRIAAHCVRTSTARCAAAHPPGHPKRSIFWLGCCWRRSGKSTNIIPSQPIPPPSTTQPTTHDSSDNKPLSLPPLLPSRRQPPAAAMASFVARRALSTSARRFAQAADPALKAETKKNPELAVRHNPLCPRPPSSAGPALITRRFSISANRPSPRTDPRRRHGPRSWRCWPLLW